MTTYSIWLKIGDNKKIQARKGLSKEEAETAVANARAQYALIPEVRTKIWAEAELTSRQRTIDFLIKQAVSEHIGGLENALLDFPESSVEYKRAKRELNHDSLFDYIWVDVKVGSKNGTFESNIRFAGNDFLAERIEYYLEKCGYGREVK